MSKEDTSCLGVNSRYGPVAVPDQAAGVVKTEGTYNELTIEFSGESADNGGADTSIPGGIRMVDYFVEVQTPFDTAIADIAFGDRSSPAANGITPLVAASLLVEGVTLPVGTFTGTWADPILEAMPVSMLTVGGAGQNFGGNARLVIRYLKA